LRRELFLDLHTLEKALERRGYRRRALAGPFSLEWRKGGYHVILNPRPHKVILRIHYDSDPSPFHSVRTKGRDLEAEFKRIIREYKRLRSVE